MLIYTKNPIDIINRRPMNESINDNIVFESPKSLLNWMHKNIKYSHDDNLWKLRSPEEVMKNKVGDCHDQALFTEEHLKKMDYNAKRLFMIEYHGDEIYEAGATHTICYYNEDEKYYWIENAWEDQRGIHGPYHSVDELKEEISHLWDYSGLNDRLFITSIGCVSPGMDLEEYVKACLRENYYPKKYYSRGIIESNIITEADDIDLEFNSPKEFLKWMDNIQYQPFRNSWRLKSKDQLIKSGKGNCIDQTELEVSVLRKLGYKPKKLFVCEYKDDGPLTDNNIGGSHVFTYYSDNSKLYWFEHSWGQYRGIHGPYADLDAIKKSVKEKWNWNKGYSNLYFCSYGNLKEGSDLKQVYDDILGKQRPKVKPYYIRESALFTEVDVGGQPADDGDGEDTADFTGEPASVTGNDGGGDPAPTNDTGGDTPPTDDSGDTEDFTTDDGGGDTSADDDGNTEDFTDDGGDNTGDDDGGDTEDFTADNGGGGDDMGGEDSGGDGENDSGGGDTGGGGAPGDGSIKADNARGLENEIFSDLTPTQISVKHKELKNNFVTMHKAIDELIERVNKMNVAEYQNAITFVSEQLSNLKEMIADYLTDVYSTKSYMENAMNYNRFLATLNGVKEILDEVNKGTPENSDNNSQ